MNTLRTALDEHQYPFHYIINRPGMGSSGPIINFVVPSENWANFAPPEEELGEFLGRVMGPEEAGNLYQQFSATFASSDSYVALLRRDLSSPSEAQGTQ